METSKLRKVCPQCSTNVYVKRAVCECGYAFPSKHKARPESTLQAMKRETLHSGISVFSEQCIEIK